MAAKELSHLLRVLEERDIDLSCDDVAWAFDSARTGDDIKAWVNEYLNPHCLLTKEELRL